MDVVDINDFMEEIDEWRIQEIEVKEDEENPRHITICVDMVKVFESVKETLFISGWLDYDKPSPTHSVGPSKKPDSLNYQRNPHYNLTLELSQKGEDGAIGALYRQLRESKAYLREELDYPFKIEYLH